MGASATRWLLLIHQIPPKPGYFRAKVGERLQRLGAVAIKNSVYVLPLNEATHEDMQWVAREIVAEGGEATLCTAQFVEGLRDDQIEALFQKARDDEYAEILEEARVATKALPPRLAAADKRRPEIEAGLALRRTPMSEDLALAVDELIEGLVIAERDDERRIELGGRMLDALLELYRRKRS